MACKSSCWNRGVALPNVEVEGRARTTRGKSRGGGNFFASLLLCRHGKQLKKLLLEEQQKLQ